MVDHSLPKAGAGFSSPKTSEARTQRSVDATARSIPERITKSAVENLSALLPRQRVLERDVPWNLVSCGTLCKESADVVGADRGLRCCFHDGHPRFAKIVVRNPKNRAVPDPGALHQHLFYFPSPLPWLSKHDGRGTC